MVPQASTKCGLRPPDHQRIGSCTSNGINSEQVPGTFSVLTISSLSIGISTNLEKVPGTFSRFDSEDNRLTGIR